MTADRRSHVEKRLGELLEYMGNDDSVKLCTKYRRDLLIRSTYEYSLSDTSKDKFLRYFFKYIELDMDDTEDIELDTDLLETLKSFADFLVDNFYLPLKAVGAKTPQPTPAQLSAIRSMQGPHSLIGTPERVSLLRSQCLVRDHHRCVISRVFDFNEAGERILQDDNAVDDDGVPLGNQPTDVLQVAHIIPHSLMESKDKNDPKLPEPKKIAVVILNMFDCDVGQIINGVDIDRPQNAMSLSPRCHASFGSFKIYLEAVPGEEHTYRVDSLIGAQRRLLNLPVTRKLFLNEERSIEPPLPRLLALHGAIAHVLHLSGAGEYIDKILRDYEDMGVHEDGTTELGRLINWRLGECFDGAVDVH